MVQLDIKGTVYRMVPSKGISITTARRQRVKNIVLGDTKRRLLGNDLLEGKKK